MATTQAAPGKKGLINFDFLQKLGKGDGIQAVYGLKADVLKSDINDIL